MDGGMGGWKNSWMGGWVDGLLCKWLGKWIEFYLKPESDLRIRSKPSSPNEIPLFTISSPLVLLNNFFFYI